MTNQYRCLVVDDERPALQLLSAYIKKLPHLNQIGACENAMETMAILQNNTIDILFLDIQMPQLTGLELLRILPNKPEIILTTAYREYAVEGFALNVTDYLVKPFSFERFAQAVNKAAEQIKLKQPIAHTIIEPRISTKASPDHFFVRTNYKMEKVVLNKVTHIESMREYVAIYTPEKRFVVNQTMNKLEKELPKDQFLRIHRSYIIGLRHISEINGNMVIIKDKKITIGASYRKAFFEQLNQL